MQDLQHPSADKLAAFVSGELATPDSIAVEEHVNHCHDCRNRLQKLSVDDVSFVAQIQDAMQVDRARHRPIFSDLAQLTSRRIGPYELLQQIGSGGMGQVWMAQQESPVERGRSLGNLTGWPDSLSPHIASFIGTGHRLSRGAMLSTIGRGHALLP